MNPAYTYVCTLVFVNKLFRLLLHKRERENRFYTYIPVSNNSNVLRTAQLGYFVSHKILIIPTNWFNRYYTSFIGT